MRRTSAYSFDRDIGRSWYADDDDLDNPSSPATDSSNIRDVSMDAEGYEKNAGGSDSPFTKYNKRVRSHSRP